MIVKKLLKSVLLIFKIIEKDLNLCVDCMFLLKCSFNYFHFLVVNKIETLKCKMTWLEKQTFKFYFNWSDVFGLLLVNLWIVFEEILCLLTFKSIKFTTELRSKDNKELWVYQVVNRIVWFLFTAFDEAFSESRHHMSHQIVAQWNWLCL